MPSIVTDKDFTQIPQYPDIAKDYAYTFDAMKKLSFDIWLSSHASQFGLHGKYKPNQPYKPAVFFDRKGYNEAISNLQNEFLKKVKDK
jgi:metallo-beta-lactamase class B